jgi:hypothetical protein
MFDAKDDHFAEIFTDAVENAVGPPPGRPHARQVIAQWFSHPVWLVDQRRGQLSAELAEATSALQSLT